MSQSNRLWLLGPSTPAIDAAERLLRETGEKVAYAVDSDGNRTREATGFVFPRDPHGVYALGQEDCPITHRVECGWVGWERSNLVVIDHHHPDGLPLESSTIGQVVAAKAA